MPVSASRIHNQGSRARRVRNDGPPSPPPPARRRPHLSNLRQPAHLRRIILTPYNPAPPIHQRRCLNRSAGKHVSNSLASTDRPVPSRVFQKLQTSTKVDPCAACRLEQHRRCAAAPEVPPPPPLPGGRAGPGCLLLHPSTQRPLPSCRQPAGQCHGGSAHEGAAAGGRGVSSDRQPCGVAARCLKTPRRTWPCSHSPAPHPPHPLIPDSTLDPPGSAPASTEQPPPPRRRRRHCDVATCAACCGSCAPTTAANTL